MQFYEVYNCHIIPLLVATCHLLRTFAKSLGLGSGLTVLIWIQTVLYSDTYTVPE